MSDKKKTTNKKKPLINPKVLRVLNIIFAVIAVISLIATLLLSPLGDKLIKKDEKPTEETTTAAPTPQEETEIHFGLPYKDGKFYWPEPTEATEDTLTNYRILVNTVNFNYENDAGVTTIFAKEDISAIMTVKPLPSVPYATLCETTAEAHGNPLKDTMLQGVEISCCYSSEEEGYKTVVYCVDDLNEGSIEIRYSYPTTYENSYENRFETMLTMFELK